MTERKKKERPEATEDQPPFELDEVGAVEEKDIAKALADHQMEAMEEVTETFFGLDEEPRGAAAEPPEPGKKKDRPDAGAGPETPLVVDPAEAKKIIETILFVAHDPLRPRDISMLFRGVGNIDVKVVRKLLAELVEEYADRTVQIVEVAEGYRMCTRPDFTSWVRRFLKAERRTRISQAGLETLAIIAYKQPITRAEIEQIRRVDCSGVLGTLLERNLIRILGRRDVVGKPIVYGTTPFFLEHFGFKNLSDMPRPEEFGEAGGIEEFESFRPAAGEILPIDDGGAGGAPEGDAALPVPDATKALAEGGAILREEEAEGGGANGRANGRANGHALRPEAAEKAEEEAEER